MGPTRSAWPERHSRRRAAGVPGGGGYATAAAMAAFYQMLIAEGTLNGVRVLSPRIVQYAMRNHTDERIDKAICVSRRTEELVHTCVD